MKAARAANGAPFTLCVSLSIITEEGNVVEEKNHRAFWGSERTKWISGYEN